MTEKSWKYKIKKKMFGVLIKIMYFCKRRLTPQNYTSNNIELK